MIEGVNSVLANAAIVRANAEQSSVVRSFAANPARVQEAASAPQAPYISPYIHLDVNYNKAVLQIRDSDTGDVLKQFPSNTTLESRRRVAAAQQNEELAQEGTFEAPQATQSQTPTPTPEFHTQEVSVERSSPGTTGVTVNAEAQVAAAAFASAAVASSAGSSTVSITA